MELLTYYVAYIFSMLTYELFVFLIQVGLIMNVFFIVLTLVVSVYQLYGNHKYVQWVMTELVSLTNDMRATYHPIRRFFMKLEIFVPFYGSYRIFVAFLKSFSENKPVIMSMAELDREKLDAYKLKNKPSGE